MWILGLKGLRSAGQRNAISYIAYCAIAGFLELRRLRLGHSASSHRSVLTPCTKYV